MNKSITFYPPVNARVNGRPVASAEIFAEVCREEEFWRWRIVDCRGVEYVDGGNFRRREDAEQSLRTAFDPVES